MRFPRSIRNTRRAFSLLELLLVVSIIGVISALSYPLVRNFSSANVLAEARTKAESLSVAKILFYRTDPIASDKWVAAEDSASKFELIKPFLFHTESGASLEEYAAAAPYDEFDLGADIRSTVTVVNDDDGEDTSDGNGNSNGNGNGNNGHGNNEDGVDVSNPGNGNGGPNGEEDPSGDVDDEIGNGNGG